MINEEKDIKISEIDCEEFEKIARTESEITTILHNLSHKRSRLWERLASQFDFDLEKDIATYFPKTKTISISRYVRSNE